MFATTSLGIFLGALYLVYKGLCVVLNSTFRKQLTILDELEELGKRRSDGCKIKGVAVIAGGSFGGLWTARVCSDHFERVLVIDPDGWINTEAGITPQDIEAKYVGEDHMRAPVNKRSHVAQYNSLHAYQRIALKALRNCFPNWDSQFRSAGGMFLIGRFNLLYSGLPHVLFEHLFEKGEYETFWCSRALLETLIRRSVKATCENVEFVTGTVTGINLDSSQKSKITSVSYKLKDDEIIHRQEAILFIDCAGPTHNGLKWLAEANHGDANTSTPANKLPLNQLLITYNPKMVYSTSVWPVDAEQRSELERTIPGGYEEQAWFFTYIAMADRGSANCAIGRVENHRVQVLCGGWGGPKLPRTPEGIVEYYRGMQGHRPMPEWIFSALEVLFKRTDEAIFENMRIPQQSRVLYDKAVNLPTNFLAIGDSCVRANPVYGQGHSKCLMGAIILNVLLHKISSDAKDVPTDFASTFFEIQERKVCSPMWESTKTQDYDYATTTPVKGESLSDGAFIRWYSKNLMLAGTWDLEVSKAFADVRQFTVPSVILFKPSILAKVLWEGLVHPSNRVA